MAMPRASGETCANPGTLASLLQEARIQSLRIRHVFERCDADLPPAFALLHDVRAVELFNLSDQDLFN